MLETLRSGGKRALADALSRIEAEPDAADTVALLDAAFAEQTGISLGLTGPPGVGKSSLMNALIKHWRAEGITIGVIAVDPSSAQHNGALLGDRTRLNTDPTDRGLFVRSMAARESLGGVSALSFPAMVLMRAMYDIVIVETVGVGQSETEIADITDRILFCAQPGSGDALQYMKAGVMEIPDLVVVTKADMGDIADRTVGDLRCALSLTSAVQLSVLTCSASTGVGVREVVEQLLQLTNDTDMNQENRRNRQALTWGESRITERFGREGLCFVHKELVEKAASAPFRATSELTIRLSSALTEAFR